MPLSWTVSVVKSCDSARGQVYFSKHAVFLPWFTWSLSPKESNCAFLWRLQSAFRTKIRRSHNVFTTAAIGMGQELGVFLFCCHPPVVCTAICDLGSWFYLDKLQTRMQCNPDDGLAALEQGLSEVESYVCSPVYDLVEPLYPCITAQHSFPDGHNMVFLPLGHHHLGVAINTSKVDKSSLELEVLCAFVLRYNYVHPCKLIQRVCMLMKSRGLYARIFATQKRLNSQNISREMLCSSQIECAPHVCV